MDAVREIANRLEPRLRDAFLAAVEQARGEADALSALDAFRRGDVPGMLAAVGISEGAFPALETALLDGRAGSFADTLAALFDGAGTVAATALAFSFAPRQLGNTRMREVLIRTIARQFVAEAVAAATETADRLRRFPVSPERAASHLIGSIGLTPAQARSLDAFRAVLDRAIATRPVLSGRLVIAGRVTRETTFGAPRPDPEAIIREFSRSLSASQRSQLRRALASSIDADAAARLVDRHRRQLVEHRAATIAATNATRLTNAGEQAAWEQGAREGVILPTARRFWRDAADERVREAHRRVSALNPNGVGLREPFRTPFGPVMFPPLEVNCRCRVVLKGARNASA